MASKDFNPNSYALKNGNFIGLPHREAEAALVFLPVPWDSTVSYAAGTADAPNHILDCSYQLDLYDADAPNTWQKGIFFAPLDPAVAQLNAQTRPLAAAHIEALEQAQTPNPEALDKINAASQKLNHWVYTQTQNYLEKGKIVGLVGGEHSVPFGFLQALAEQHDDFGILQIDAHCDLRQAYEDFTYSHASIFYNALEEIPQISRLTQVGIRDYCHEEQAYIQASKGRIKCFFDAQLQRARFHGTTFAAQVADIIKSLPSKVYISFDIDGLEPSLCPNTGTPVPGGLTFAQAHYLLHALVQANKTIIGFDLCEVGAASEWDGNVGARILYKLALTALETQNNNTYN